MPQLNVNEIFYTIQGEGPTTGTPSIFLRLSGCNLRCYWCDTTYTWLYSESMADGIRQKLPVELKTYPLNVYSKEQETHTMQFDDILAEMAQYSCTHIVISGGEPLLQAELIDFSSLLLEKGYSLEIETNGTQSPQGYHQSIRFNVSPKLENSYNDLDRRYIPAVLDEFLVADTIFKFVVSSREDLQEVQEIISNHSIPPDRVYLMPEGKTSEELAPRSKWLIELCKEYNYRYSHRLHVELFDKKRGV